MGRDGCRGGGELWGGVGSGCQEEGGRMESE